jgi:hypothetical protein
MMLQQHDIRRTQSHQLSAYEAKVWPRELHRADGGVLHLPSIVSQNAVVAAHTIASDGFNQGYALDKELRCRGGFNNHPPVECLSHDSSPPEISTADACCTESSRCVESFRFRNAKIEALALFHVGTPLRQRIRPCVPSDCLTLESTRAAERGGSLDSARLHAPRGMTQSEINSPSVSPPSRDRSQQTGENRLSEPSRASHA